MTGNGYNPRIYEAVVLLYRFKDLVSIFVGQTNVKQNKIDMWQGVSELDYAPSGGLPERVLSNHTTIGEQSYYCDVTIDLIFHNKNRCLTRWQRSPSDVI